MIIKLKQNTNEEQINSLTYFIQTQNLTTQVIRGSHYDVINIIGDTSKIDSRSFYAFTFVEQVIRVQETFKKVSKINHEKTIIDINGLKIGDGNLTIIGGPCAVENKSSLNHIAKGLHEMGLGIIRAGVYKPRTSPYSFQGLGQEGIDLLAEVKEKYNLKIVSEITDISQIDEFINHIDIFQVGARNMQNFELLKALGKINKPVLLKRGFANTIEEWLMSAEYILSGGNKNVILCERGIRTFDNTYTRNTLDISSIPLIKRLTHLPIFVDPSHALGRWDLIEEISLAAVAAGADGLLIEVHDNPELALSDGSQSLKIENFKRLVTKTQKLKEFLNTL